MEAREVARRGASGPRMDWQQSVREVRLVRCIRRGARRVQDTISFLNDSLRSCTGLRV